VPAVDGLAMQAECLIKLPKQALIK